MLNLQYFQFNICKNMEPNLSEVSTQVQKVKCLLLAQQSL